MDGRSTSASTDRLSLLLVKRGSTADARLRAALGAAKLTPRHVAALTYLEREPACQQGLVGMLEVDPSVLVTILNELERSELIRRRRDPTDRRRHIVEITSQGVSALRALDAAMTEVECSLFGDLSASEQATLHALLNRVAPHRVGRAAANG